MSALLKKLRSRTWTRDYKEGVAELKRLRSLAPAPGSPSGIEAKVCADIAARQRMGLLKYGTTVADNPLSLKKWLQHAYEECLDQAVYLKRAIREMENY